MSEDTGEDSPCRARARRHVAVERSARCLDPPVCTSRSASSSGSSCPCPFSRRRPPPQSPRQSLRNGRAASQRASSGNSPGVVRAFVCMQRVLSMCQVVCGCAWVSRAVLPPGPLTHMLGAWTAARSGHADAVGRGPMHVRPTPRPERVCWRRQSGTRRAGAREDSAEGGMPRCAPDSDIL